MCYLVYCFYQQKQTPLYIRKPKHSGYNVICVQNAKALTLNLIVLIMVYSLSKKLYGVSVDNGTEQPNSTYCNFLIFDFP